MIVSVPATSANLGPGFDTLGLALSLRNEVKIRRSRFFSVSIKGEGKNISKMKSGNIFINIFNEHYKNLTGAIEPFRFEFFNNIPISRGLGSSSATIVSALRCAYEMAQIEVTKEKLLNCALAYEHHPDNITPAVMGGFTAACVENRSVYCVKHEMPSSIRAVVVIPNVHMSTVYSRGSLPKKYSKEDAVFNLSRSSLLTAAMMSGNFDLLRVASMDRFHQEIRMKALPELFSVQRTALDGGALMSTLSGSGSSFFNLVYADDAHNIAQLLSKTFESFRVEIFDFDNDGAIVKAEQ